LEAFQGQSHRAGQRHSFHFSAIGNEPGAKGLPSEGEVFLNSLTLENSCNNMNPRRVQLFYQSHRTGQRHSFHFSAIGNEPGAKGLPLEGEVFVEIGNPCKG